MSRHALLFCLLALAFCAVTHAELAVEVPQGQVGVWAGDGEASCGMDGRTYKAIAGNCYYPVDFERKPGWIEIARWDGGSMQSAKLIVTEVEYPVQDIDFPDESYVHLSEEDLARHYREQSEIKPLLRRRGGEARFTLPLGKALSPLPEGKYFGVPRTFNGEPKNAHTGTDYAVGTGTPVLAVADGTVLMVADYFFAGKSVYINHGAGLVSMVFHLDAFDTETGAEVSRGDGIAKVGSTGRSTGPHLHLGLRWFGARIDPTPLMGDPSALPQVSER